MNQDRREDPLAELVVDAASVDRAAIAASLNGIVGIDESSARVVTQALFKSLPQRQQLIAFLLGIEAAVLLGVISHPGLTPGDLSKETGIPSGTVRRILPELLRKRSISQNAEGQYFIAHHQIPSAIDLLASARVEARSSTTQRRTANGA